MQLKFAVVLGLVFLIAACYARPAGEEDYAEYEESEPAPPPPPKPAARPNPLLNRRNPLARNSAAKPTSTTPAPPPPQEEEVEGEEEEIVEEVPAEASSTTESPKKLKTGVRPFRSNDDLLAALKRRREQAASNKTHSKPVVSEPDNEASVEPVTPKPSRASTSGRRRFNTGSKSEPATEAEQASTSAPARTGRRFNTRS